MSHCVNLEPSAPATQRLARKRQNREESRKRIVDAATELVRTRSYSELSVGEVMDRAGIGRTIFYRHFDDLADLLMRAGRDAADELFEAEQALAHVRVDASAESIEVALAAAVSLYRHHGPVLRAIAEAAGVDSAVAAGYGAQRRRFDSLVEDAIRSTGTPRPGAPDPSETARALNLMNESYLLDAFGREPRVSEETAVETLTAIWAGSVRA